MRVLLVDDQPLFIEGLQNLLEARGIEVVGKAGDGLEALARARVLRPDVIVMDIKMPRCDGLQATRLIKSELPAVKIVMLTVSGEDEDLFEAVKSGASGYLLKSMDAHEFYDLIGDLARGEAPLSRGLATRILEEFARQAGREKTAAEDSADDGEGLTPRQTEILSLVAQGLTYKEIGDAVCLAERTIKYHMSQILERLHVRNRAQAIAYAKKSGYIADQRIALL